MSARGFVGWLRSKIIFAIEVKGTAKIAPITPQTKVQKIKLAITTTGLKSIPLPSNFVSKILPTKKWTTDKDIKAYGICHVIPNSSRSTGKGSIVAINGPTFGIKLSINVRQANVSASGVPAIDKIIQVSKPAKKDTNSFIIRYFDICFSILVRKGFSLVAWPIKINITNKVTKDTVVKSDIKLLPMEVTIFIAGMLCIYS